MRLQSQFEQALMNRVIIMFFGLLARVFHGPDLHPQTQLVANTLDHFRELIDRKELDKLVQNTQLPFLGGILQREYERIAWYL